MGRQKDMKFIFEVAGLLSGLEWGLGPFSVIRLKKMDFVYSTRKC